LSPAGVIYSNNDRLNENGDGQMLTLTDVVTASPPTADGFTASALILIGAIIALFVVMKNKLKKK